VEKSEKILRFSRFLFLCYLANLARFLVR